MLYMLYMYIINLQVVKTIATIKDKTTQFIKLKFNKVEDESINKVT
jgi:hypothetical protein